MSRIRTGHGPDDCACVARSLRLAGYATSIRLEAAFWDILDEIAAAGGTTTPRYLDTLYEEALARDGEIPNFTALLRVTCTRYLRASASGAPASGATPAQGHAPQAARILEPVAAE